MSIKALPRDVRSLLCASAQSNNYKRAVEELVYNSLDAESTSIAIRVHIPENRIHVIDNGCGIVETDFDALGIRHMTSKLTDIATLKSMPKCYGYRGEFLANIIEISQCVKITSRRKDMEETWAQTFFEGKKRPLVKMPTRPSKGTTIEIKGFLYNLNIQKRGIDAVNDLQNIKAFLEQLSIVHNEISLSLRDDSRNEIVFQIHKKRDVYQTLLTLFNIEQNDVQELQIVKSQYKVKAFIGKTDAIIGRHWVYVNGKFIQHSSKLHNMVNGYLKKYLLLSDTKELKSRNRRKEENLYKSSLPFYFILVTCPYIDYDISFKSSQSIIEFKNWEQIKIILEKLIKFYVGDINLKQIKRTKEKVCETNISTTKNNGDTHCQIKKIIHRILGTPSKKISQLQHGIKGKLIKRKKRTKNKEENCRNVVFKNDKMANAYNEVKSINIPKKNMNLNSKHEEKLVMEQGNIKHIKNSKLFPKNKRISGNFNDNKLEKTDVITKNGIKTSKIKKNKKKNRKNITNMSLAETVHTPVSITNNLCEIKPNKISKPKDKNREIQMFQFLDEADAVAKKSKIVGQKVEDLLRHQYNYDTNRHINKEFRRNKPCTKGFQAPLSPKLNQNTIIQKVKHKMKINPFKTTYDLVQTILATQKEIIYNQDDNSSRIGVEGDPISNHIQTSVHMNRLPQSDKVSKHKDIHGRQEKRSIFKDKMPWHDLNNIIPRNFGSCNLTCENTYSTHNKRYCESKDIYNYYSASNESVQYSLKCADIFKEYSNVVCTQNYPSSYLTNVQTLSKLTYDSHNYSNFYQQICDDNRHQNKAQNLRFITKQSKDNFITSTRKYLYKDDLKKKTKRSHAKRTQYNGEHVRQMIDESYEIEFTTSNEMRCLKNQEEITIWDETKVPTHNVGDENNSKHHFYSPNYEPTTSFGNTYTIPTYSISSSCSSHRVHHNITPQHAKRIISHEICEANSVHYSNVESNIHIVVTKDEKNKEKENCEIIMASQLECFDSEVNINDDVQPINFCETVFHENASIEKEFAFSFNRNSNLNDSLYNNIDANSKNNEEHPSKTTRHQNINKNISHHFSNTLLTNQSNALNDINNLSPLLIDKNNKNDLNNRVEHNSLTFQESNTNYNKNVNYAHFEIDDDHFNFKDRLRFLPKGMSQIFEKTASKAMCDYNLDEDYYEDIIYNDFADDIKMQAEIYEPAVQNVENYTTKDIQKFKNKVQKDNTSLIFDETSLKEALMLNQVDNKFIATIMQGRHRGLEDLSEYLILFDQHAVHERIRLEKNLASYFIEDKWNSVPVNKITLKLSKDEILYLHNYKNKFNQLGLQWTILDTGNVSVTSIPEAILGKNPREVDKVMKAVKNLIIEEINVIKLQKGCISLYPKSIMDLIFSEACRYAIKFGDKLSKSDCIDLIKDLSNCKTPFQCAHGRPVMAVLLEIKNDKRDYKINMPSLNEFKLQRKE